MQNLNYNTVRLRDIDISSSVIRATSEQSDKRVRSVEWLRAEKWLLDTLAEAERVSDEQGWLTQEDVERKLGYGVED
jgi:hypothetical protein